MGLLKGDEEGRERERWNQPLATHLNSIKYFARSMQALSLAKTKKQKRLKSLYRVFCDYQYLLRI